MEQLKNLLTIQDVADRLKVTPQYARKLIKEEKLVATKLGSQWVVNTDDLEKYIQDYDVIIEPDDHARKNTDVPEIVALSFFFRCYGFGYRNEEWWHTSFIGLRI